MRPDPPANLQAAWRQQIHAAGMRVTPQREALLAAAWRLGHATAESLVVELARNDSSVNSSTVYRALEALERIGLVRHAHLGATGPTYHIAVESPHIHLHCNSCGRILSVGVAEADAFVRQLLARTGFEADITHAAIFGRCRDCLVAASANGGDDGV